MRNNVGELNIANKSFPACISGGISMFFRMSEPKQLGEWKEKSERVMRNRDLKNYVLTLV